MLRALQSRALTAAVAWAALFVALGGVVFATTQLPKNSVTSSAIRHCAITTDKLAKNSVTGPKVKPGSLDGSDIDLSHLGTVPNASVCETAALAAVATELQEATYVRATTTVPPADDASIGMATGTARCPAGHDVVGGGADLESDTDEIVNDSHPAGTAAWEAAALNSGPDALKFTVWAICVPVRRAVTAG